MVKMFRSKILNTWDLSLRQMIFWCDLMIGLLPVIFIGERYFLENENT